MAIVDYGWHGDRIWAQSLDTHWYSLVARPEMNGLLWCIRVATTLESNIVYFLQRMPFSSRILI